MSKIASKFPYFWTDRQQAEEKLVDSYVMYDGLPAYVAEIMEGDKVQARIKPAGKPNVWVDMDDPKFERFRKLPPIGWANVSIEGYTGAVYIERTARVTRHHGLENHNTKTFVFNSPKAPNSLSVSPYFAATQVFKNPDYVACIKGDYPDVRDILLNISPTHGIAFSPRFAVYRCAEGVRWLYRDKERIGTFMGADTLSLFPRLGFYREEIMDEPRFNISKIQEF